MLGLLARRLAFTVPMLVVVSFCVFSLIVLVPGDPAVALAGENPAPEQIAAEAASHTGRFLGPLLERDRD